MTLPHEQPRAAFVAQCVASVPNKGQQRIVERMSRDRHRAHVAKALRDGLTVPAEVLADYPEMKVSK